MCGFFFSISHNFLKLILIILGGGAFKKINDDENDMDNKLAGFALRGIPQSSSASWNLKF
jgi:hypothetical protein